MHNSHDDQAERTPWQDRSVNRMLLRSGQEVSRGSRD